MASVNDPHHHRLLAEIIAHAQARGCHVGSAAYHDVMPETVCKALQVCFDPTALYVRGRADRIAVKGEHSVMFEAKTSPGPRMPIEALPLRHWVQLGIPCLYVCRETVNHRTWAFRTTALPKFWEVVIPAVWSPVMRAYFTDQFRATWPDVEIGTMPRNNGSNDPLIFFTYENLDAVTVDWKQCFEFTEPVGSDSGSAGSAAPRSWEL